MYDTQPRARAGARRLAEVRLRQRFHFRSNWEALEDRRLLSAASADLSALTVTPSLDVISLAGKTTTPTGYSPAQIRAAYGVNSVTFSNGTVSGTGAGQTIAIVVAYNDTSITSDLARLSSSTTTTASTATTTTADEALTTPSTPTTIAQASSSSSSSTTSSMVGQGQTIAASLPTQSLRTGSSADASRSLVLDSTPPDPQPASQNQDTPPAPAIEEADPADAPVLEDAPAAPAPALQNELPSNPLPIVPDEPEVEDTTSSIADAIRVHHPMRVAGHPQPRGLTWADVPATVDLSGEASWAAPALAGAVAVTAGTYQILLARAERIRRRPSDRRFPGR